MSVCVLLEDSLQRILLFENFPLLSWVLIDWIHIDENGCLASFVHDTDAISGITFVGNQSELKRFISLHRIHLSTHLSQILVSKTADRLKLSASWRKPSIQLPSDDILLPSFNFSVSKYVVKRVGAEAKNYWKCFQNRMTTIYWKNKLNWNFDANSSEKKSLRLKWEIW